MNEIEGTIAELGNEPPLLADGRAGPPDKREVSARWLSGTFLTGVIELTRTFTPRHRNALVDIILS